MPEEFFLKFLKNPKIYLKKYIFFQSSYHPIIINYLFYTFTLLHLKIIKDEILNEEFSEANATMKTIDLSSSVISPFIAGLIINKIGYLIACFIFIIYNLLSWIVEGLILNSVYLSTQQLQIRAPISKSSS